MELSTGDGWVEEEIRKQLEDISVEDLELLDDGHGLGYYGDNQIESIDSCYDKDTVEVEDEVDDDSTSIFSCYLAKLAELGNSSHSILREAKQTLSDIQNRPDVINEGSRMGIQDGKERSQSQNENRSSRNGNDQDETGARLQERCGQEQYVTSVTNSPKTSGTTRVVCESRRNIETTASVTNSDSDSKKTRRRSETIASNGRSSVKSSYSRRHSYDTSTGGKSSAGGRSSPGGWSGTESRSSTLLYDPQEQVFLKSSGQEDRERNMASDDGYDYNPGIQNYSPSYETEQLMKELHLRQEMWSIHIQELERQRSEHNKVLEEHEVQVVATRTRAARAIQAAVRGWKTRKLHRPALLARVRDKRRQEERQLQRIVWLQAQCRGYLMRTTYSQHLQEWRVKREARQAVLVRSLSLLQARARGRHERDSISDKIQLWRNVRAGMGRVVIAKLQGVCRGYLLRRITTSILNNLRDTRLKEKELATGKGEAERESVSEIVKKKLVAIDSLRSSTKMKMNTEHKTKRSKNRPHSRSSRRSRKEKSERWIILLQAMARGFITRRYVQMNAASKSTDKRSESSTDNQVMKGTHLHKIPDHQLPQLQLEEIQQERQQLENQQQENQQQEKQQQEKQQQEKQQEKQQQEKQEMYERQQQEQPLQQPKPDIQNGHVCDDEQQNQVMRAKKEQKLLEEQKSIRQYQSMAETQKYTDSKLQEQNKHQHKNHEESENVKVTHYQSVQSVDTCATRTQTHLISHTELTQKQPVVENWKYTQDTTDRASVKNRTKEQARFDKDTTRGGIFTLPFVERTSRGETDRMDKPSEPICPDVEELARHGRTRSTYKTELEHATQPLSGRALLGLLEERMATWQNAQRNRKPSQGNRTSSTSKLTRTSSTSEQTRTSSSSEQTRTSSVENSPGSVQKSRLLEEDGCAPLTEYQLLSASPEGTSLLDVVQVNVSGCGNAPSLSSLKVCPRVMSVTLVQCGLQKVVGLHNCPHLRQLQLQGNELKELNLAASVCASLSFISVDENCLTNLQGVGHCHNLLHLSVARNRLARASNLQHNKLITKLNLDQNILINCKGLEVLSELEYVSLCDNHLVLVEGLNNSFCLQQLLLSHNNIQQPPQLDCHMLLTELIMNDNNLSDVSAISSAWLPRLRHLCLSNNCVTQLDSLACLLLLSTLNLAYNSIYDLPVLLQSIHGCYSLQSLALAGNPVVEERSFRRLLHTAVPSLCKLDDYELIKHPANSGTKGTSFASNSATAELSYVPDAVANSYIYKLCIQQECRELEMKAKHNNTMSALGRVGASGDIHAARAALDARVKCCHDYHSLLKQHLTEWENFQPIKQQKPKRLQILDQPLDEDMKQQDEHRSIHQDQVASDEHLNPEGDHHPQPADHIETSCNNEVKEDTSLLCAVLRVQSLWRGLTSRREVKKMRENKDSEKIREEEKRKIEAAIVIQANVRGYLLRRHLHHILNGSPDPEELNEEEQLLEFFDESELEKELDDDFGPLSLDEQFIEHQIKHTANTTAIKKGAHGVELLDKVAARQRTDRLIPPTDFNESHVGYTETLLPGATTYTDSYQQGSNDRSAMNTLSSVTTVSKNTSSVAHLPPVSSSHKSSPPPQHSPASHDASPAVREVWGNSNTSTHGQETNIVADKAEAKKTLKEELTKEWGFSNSATAQLMLKRAKRQKKLEQTAKQRKIMADPSARLARFRRQGLIQHRTLQPSPVKPPETSSPASLPVGKHSQVFRWSHSENSILGPAHHEYNSHTHSTLGGATKQSPSTKVLPDMEPHILAGYSTRLISSDSLNELVLKGTSSDQCNSERKQ